MIGDESEGGDCDEVMCTGWGYSAIVQQNKV